MQLCTFYTFSFNRSMRDCSGCCKNILEKSTWRRRGLPGLTVHDGEEAGLVTVHQEAESSRRKLVFFTATLLLSLRYRPMEWGCPHSEWVFSLQLASRAALETFPKVCHPDDCSSVKLIIQISHYRLEKQMPPQLKARAAFAEDLG